MLKHLKCYTGLRILLTCYKDSLSKEWLNIAATIRKYGTECGEWSVALWRLLDYIDLYRTPLYIMLLRYIIIIVIIIIIIMMSLCSALSGGGRG